MVVLVHMENAQRCVEKHALNGFGRLITLNDDWLLFTQCVVRLSENLQLQYLYYALVYTCYFIIVASLWWRGLFFGSP